LRTVVNISTAGTGYELATLHYYR